MILALRIYSHYYRLTIRVWGRYAFPPVTRRGAPVARGAVYQHTERWTVPSLSSFDNAASRLGLLVYRYLPDLTFTVPLPP